MYDILAHDFKITCLCFRGLTPAQAETNYLNKVKWLEMYGVDNHTVLVRITLTTCATNLFYTRTK